MVSKNGDVLRIFLCAHRSVWAVFVQYSATMPGQTLVYNIVSPFLQQQGPVGIHWPRQHTIEASLKDWVLFDPPIGHGRPLVGLGANPPASPNVAQAMQADVPVAAYVQQ